MQMHFLMGSSALHLQPSARCAVLQLVWNDDRKCEVLLQDGVESIAPSDALGSQRKSGIIQIGPAL